MSLAVSSTLLSERDRAGLALLRRRIASGRLAIGMAEETSARQLAVLRVRARAADRAGRWSETATPAANPLFGVRS